ncbi:MAG: response regulator transcription factor [Clostridiales bacterium]|nr:response regulator transcription factor [Clostridiales bacterium]
MDRLKVMIVDDDSNIAQLIRLYAEKEGWLTTCCSNGMVALQEFNRFMPDVVILDIIMPQMDGWETCRRIREFSTVPIIMLTAKGDTLDVVSGLDMGADDYITKPFEPKILISRIKANTRRIKGKDSKVISYPDLTIEIDNYKVIYKGTVYEFPPKEIQLLYFLASNPNKVFSREQLLENVWGFDYFGETRTIDVHMKRIRCKLKQGNRKNEDESAAWALRTVWGVGYKFELK